MQNNKFLKLINNAQSIKDKGIPNGYVPLDENGKIDINNLPDITQDCIGEDWGEITGITKPPMPVSIINENIKNYPYWAIVNKKYFDDICPFLVMSKTKFYVGQSNLWQGYFFNSGTSDIGTDCAYSNYINGQWKEVKFVSNAGFAIHTDERTTAQPFVIFDYNFSLLFSQDYFLPEYRGKEVTKFKESLQRIKIKRGTDDNVNSYTGDTGELVVNISSKTIHVQDGSTQGGIALAKKEEVDTLSSRVDEVFQSVSNGKNLLARAITDKGIDTLATDNFETMSNNIKNIKSVDNFKIYLGEEEPESPEEGCLWFPEIDANEKVNLAFTNTESHLQKDDGTILGTISLKEVDRFPLLNISNFMMVRMFNFKYFKDGFGIITPAYICNGGEWFCVYNFPPFDGTGIKYKIKIDNRYDNLTSYVGCKLSMSNIVQAPIKNNYIINCKIKTECDIEAPVINLK